MNCLECGKSFTPTRLVQKFCSQICAARTSARRMSSNKKKGIDGNCENCGKKIYIPRRSIGKKKFCSAKCRDQKSYFFELNKKKRNGENKKCEVCGASFYVPGARIKTAKYCSNLCRNNRPVNYRKTACVVCGVVFTMKNKGAPQKYCSIPCARKARKFFVREDRRHKNRKQIALMGSCQECGYKDNLKILGVHHKDKNPKNNSKENLEVLCPNCHSLKHQTHVMNNTGMRQ